MKTPWEFLVRLTSRRPSAKAQESSVGNDAGSKALESEVEHTSALPPSSTVAAGASAHNEDGSADQASVASDEAKGDGEVVQALKPPIDTELARTTARNEADPSGAEANSLVPKRAASTKSQSKPLVKRRERRKRAKPHMAAQSAIASKHHQSLQPSSSRDVFFQEVGTLEEEIKMLRTQLARKLHLQNVQLKKMLERFDIS
ncbi:hypothetical protein [Sinorhizobium sp. BJ1]|uniref:hypothetical protein n=1 Tax=Sinorhizobium sp. BJ1 TaxID=2035455 RepID=UPI000BE96147|nr:hypothetical protein [Sinorhizobium sp. BJ1]PDT81186.1 hypothetical protein CO676_22970 [Sinorhizobium sp. BJ1]